ncbi:fimbrial protein [Burkholderia sp. Bp9126]|nr:fimbrial protein [Burkholderia sp. Bp9126]
MLSLTGGLPIRPTVPTCKVQNSAIGVPLGTIATLTLDRDGASPYKTFSIDLNCSGGSAGTATKMYITLTDATDPANRSGQLSLASTGSGAAKGVAVEIRRSSDDSIVRFGPDSADAGNANQWFVGEFGNTGVSIPLKARYVKTSTALGPGAADAKATFTMSYQ